MTFTDTHTSRQTITNCLDYLWIEVIVRFRLLLFIYLSHFVIGMASSQCEMF